MKGKLRRPFSVLLLDDNADVLQHYQSEIQRSGQFIVTTAIDGARALSLATTQLFDAIVIDAKLDYKGLEFGGLRLADDLRSRYGRHSIIIVSRYITSHTLDLHSADYEFIEKHDGRAGRSFGSEVRDRIKLLCSQQYAFIAMPFDKSLDALYRRQIKPAIENAGLRCVRVDEVAHNRRLDEFLFTCVANSKLVIFVADGANPNAYYEAGFADAMKKEVIVVARELSELRFDVRNRHTVTYGGEPDRLRSRLNRKISDIRELALPGY